MWPLGFERLERPTERQFYKKLHSYPKWSFSFIKKNSIQLIRVGRSVECECLWSGIEELGLLMELLNFQVEIPTLNRSNSTIKVGFSSPLQGKTSKSYIFPTT
jgi:hypothetical protein